MNDHLHLRDGVHVEFLDEGALVLGLDSTTVHRLDARGAAAMRLIEDGICASDVPDELAGPVTELIDLGLVVAPGDWSRRKLLRAGAVAAGVVIASSTVVGSIDLPEAAAADSSPNTTVTLPQSGSYTSSTPGTAAVQIPAGRAVTFTLIGGGGGGGSCQGYNGGAASKLTGTIPAQASNYTLDVTVAAGGGASPNVYDWGAAGSGAPTGAHGGYASHDTNATGGGGGGGGGASAITSTTSGVNVTVVAPGGGGAGGGGNTTGYTGGQAPAPATGAVGASGVNGHAGNNASGFGGGAGTVTADSAGGAGGTSGGPTNGANGTTSGGGVGGNGGADGSGATRMYGGGAGGGAGGARSGAGGGGGSAKGGSGAGSGGRGGGAGGSGAAIAVGATGVNATAADTTAPGSTTAPPAVPGAGGKGGYSQVKGSGATDDRQGLAGQNGSVSLTW